MVKCMGMDIDYFFARYRLFCSQIVAGHKESDSSDPTIETGCLTFQSTRVIKYLNCLDAKLVYC